jgi:hypothetical protein
MVAFKGARAGARQLEVTIIGIGERAGWECFLGSISACISNGILFPFAYFLWFNMRYLVLAF